MESMHGTEEGAHRTGRGMHCELEFESEKHICIYAFFSSPPPVPCFALVGGGFASRPPFCFVLPDRSRLLWFCAICTCPVESADVHSRPLFLAGFTRVLIWARFPTLWLGVGRGGAFSHDRPPSLGGASLASQCSLISFCQLFWLGPPLALTASFPCARPGATPPRGAARSPAFCAWAVEGGSTSLCSLSQRL